MKSDNFGIIVGIVSALTFAFLIGYCFGLSKSICNRQIFQNERLIHRTEKYKFLLNQANEQCSLKNLLK